MLFRGAVGWGGQGCGWDGGELEAVARASDACGVEGQGDMAGRRGRRGGSRGKEGGGAVATAGVADGGAGAGVGVGVGRSDGGTEPRADTGRMRGAWAVSWALSSGALLYTPRRAPGMLA